MVSFLVEFGLLFLVPISWALLVRWTLGFFGIHPLSGGTVRPRWIFLPLDLRKVSYVLVNGVIVQGGAIFLGLAVSRYVAGKYFYPTEPKLSVVRLMLVATTCLLIGIWAGASSWRATQHHPAHSHSG